MKRYFKYVKPYITYFILGPLLMLIEVAGDVVLPSLVADIINIGAANRDVGYIIRTGIIMVLFVFIMIGGGVGSAYFASKASMNFGADLRKDLFHRVQQFSFANIDKFSTGSLITRLTNDVTQLQNTIMMGLRMLFRAPGMLIGAVIMAFRLNRSLAMILLGVLPILAIGIGIIIKLGFPLFGKMQEKLDRLNSTIQENLTNVRVIKSFVREDFEEDKFAKANNELKDAGMAAFHVVICQMPLMSAIMNITTLSVVWFGGRQIMVGQMEVGNLTAFITYITQVLMSLMMFAMVLLGCTRAVASSKRIVEVLDAEIDLTDAQAGRKNTEVTRGKVEFKNVSFRYYKENHEKVLDGINLTIEPGQTVGIIGSTGCGKTSLVQLIPRLYDADEGEVLVDDINVKDYSLKNLRNGVGMVLQKNVLFSGTIMDNLKWGDAAAQEEEIFAAADAAQAHDFITSFPEGYETELGQGGVNVSGGQKQRLCIARALLKKPAILILDDSTSAVDTATEAKIRQAFATTLKNTTKIIIAQRISSVMEADQIVVMDEGMIVGLGNHEELLNSCEAYQEIYDSQMENRKEAGA